MKKFFLLLTISLFCFSAGAQDIITKTTGVEIEAVVTEINSDTIKYRKFSNLDGPLYSIPTNQVLSIVFENGEKEVFNENVNSAPVQSISPNIQQGLRYRQLKSMYSSKDYVRDIMDPYSPGWCAFGSFVLPGLGQICCGEWGRGLAFIGSGIGWTLLTAPTLTGLWLVGEIGLGVWAICDAVKVAKVIDMYYQDLKKYSSLDLNVYPSFAYVPTGLGFQPTAGLTLAISF